MLRTLSLGISPFKLLVRGWEISCSVRLRSLFSGNVPREFRPSLVPRFQLLYRNVYDFRNRIPYMDRMPWQCILHFSGSMPLNRRFPEGLSHNNYLAFLIPFFNLLASLSPISSLYTSSAVSPFLFLSFLSDFTLTVTSFAPPLA